MSGPEIAIGAASAAEYDAVADLLRSSGLPEAGLREHLDTLLVAREHGQIVGSAALELYGTDALLRSVAVEASRRGRGLGRRLVAAALDLARARGVAAVYLLTETAPEYFPRLGFRVLSRADVPPRVQQSVEFTSACCARAAVMGTLIFPVTP